MSTKNKRIPIVFFCFFFFGWNPPPPVPTISPPPPTHTHTQKFFRFGFFVKIHILERVCTLKVIHIFWNDDCTTCFTLCRWLLFCILLLLTVWLTVLVSMFPPPPPPPPPPSNPHFFFFSDLDFFVKIHLLESSKLELKGLYFRSYSHILKCWLYHMPF